MSIPLLDSENADRDLTSQVTVLTDTPDASAAMQCQAVVFLGDGTKNLDATGGDFEMTITIGGNTVEPDPQSITVSSGQTRAVILSEPFAVPPNNEVIIKVKSPNAADTDVDVTCYLYDATAPTASAGAVTFTYTLTSTADASPVADCAVWATTDEAGTNVVASGTTDASGEVVFYLDAATYYIWRQKVGWDFTNPDTEVIA